MQAILAKRARRSPVIAVAAALAGGALLYGCQDARPIVSLEEAKKISARFEGQGFVPPPRTISDITAVLDQHQPDPAKVAAQRQAADARPTLGMSNRDLAWFHYNRAFAAEDLGRTKQRLDDLREAVRLGRGDSDELRYMLGLSNAELRAGNVKRATELREETLRVIPENLRGRTFPTLQMLALIAAHTGDLDTANRRLGEAERLLAEAAGWRGPGPAVHRDSWHALVNWARAGVLESSGKLVEAEAAMRAALAGQARMLAKPESLILNTGGSPHSVYESGVDLMVIDLAQVLRKQGRLVEAETEARRALLSTLNRHGRYAVESGYAVVALALVIREQGRYVEAERLGRAALDIYRDSGIEPGSFREASARAVIARNLASQGRWQEARAEYDATRKGLAGNQLGLDFLFARDTNYAFTLMRTGDAAAAIPTFQAAVTRNLREVGERHYNTAESRGFLGVALAQINQKERALAEFQAAMPILLSPSRQSEDEEESGAARDGRLQTIVENYIGLLADIRGTALEAQAKVDVVGESFRLADAVRGRAVQRALVASAARAAAAEPALADLARREQDAQKQIAALYGLLASVLASPPKEQDPKAVATLREQIDSLRGARATIRQEIERRFPDYVNLIDPRPATIEQARAALRPGEALIATLVSNDRTFVWAVPHQGTPAFGAVPLGQGQIATMVADLRKALDPNAATLGDIPPYDVALANRLYEALLKPVETGWANAQDLLVVPHRALGQIPWSVLVTEPHTLAADTGALFSNYQRVPFLARRVAVTQLPSVAALASLRALPPGSATRQSFIGFADPWFNADQAKQGRSEAADPRPLQTRGRTQTAGLATRGLPLIRRNAPTTQTVDSAELGLLPRLPDTADEVRSIALALKADPIKDVLTGAAANERNVKTMDLSNRRIVMFATHGLVPGDLNGLTQPALALSAPQIADVDGDGLLTLDEILALKLNADWVVLSACNTATGEGAGAEAVSGLGRAFFYAGARALLVSNWPVETNSARLLTSDLFRRQAEDPALARAEALRRAMLALIDGEGYVDPASGRAAFSHAHPIFWAPFSLVGDGGGRAPQS